jgi:hypothetical protein
MEPYRYDLLQQYADNELSADQRSGVEDSLQNDPQLRDELTALIASAEAVRYYGISQLVGEIQQEYLATKQLTVKTAKVRSVFGPALRVAASIIIIAAAFGVYKYSSVNTNTVAADYYLPYELNRVRGEANANTLENAYNNKDWHAVISIAGQPNAGSKELFLSGAAYLELNQPAKAAATFEQLIAHNKQTQSNYFQDEAEYYLALSYIRNNQPAQAIPVLKKIRADQSHLYYGKAHDASLADLTILSWKK